MKSYLISLLLASASCVQAMQPAPQVRHVVADQAMTDRALSIIRENKHKITQEDDNLKSTYSLPSIRDSIGREVGPEVQGSYYPGSHTYLASMIRRAKDKKGNKYTEMYGFTDDQGARIFHLFKELKNPRPVEVETENITLENE